MNFVAITMHLACRRLRIWPLGWPWLRQCFGLKQMAAPSFHLAKLATTCWLLDKQNRDSVSTLAKPSFSLWEKVPAGRMRGAGITARRLLAWCLNTTSPTELLSRGATGRSQLIGRAGPPRAARVTHRLIWRGKAARSVNGSAPMRGLFSRAVRLDRPGRGHYRNWPGAPRTKRPLYRQRSKLPHAFPRACRRILCRVGRRSIATTVRWY